MSDVKGENMTGVNTGLGVPANGCGMLGRHQRGAVSGITIVLLLILAAALGAGIWWFLGSQGSSLVATVGGGPSQADADDADEQALPTSELSVDQLYKAARGAMRANRMVTPPGNNALEFYLAILARRPNDADAINAVRELFPFATGGAEDQISQGNYDEATRIIDLLAKADPSNYSLTILRSKLDAKRRQVEREQQLAQQQATAAAARTQTAAAPAAAAGAAATADAGSAPAPSPAASAPAATTGATAQSTAAASPSPAASQSAAVAEAPPRPVASGGESRDVRMVSPPRPQYPAAAARARQSGWVEVEFTVTAEGAVQDAHVVASNPGRVFDREAVRAIEQAKFEPRLDRGQAVGSKLRRRIEFKLGE